MTSRKKINARIEKAKLEHDRECKNVDEIYRPYGRIPVEIHVLAKKKLRALLNGTLHPKYHKSSKVVSLDVTFRYRLLRRMNDTIYILCHHSDYDYLRKQAR